MLKHEAIPGFMEAMTMSYPLKDPGVISELHAGDRITADLVAQEDAAGPVNYAGRPHCGGGTGARPDTLPTVQYHVPAPGAMPFRIFRFAEPERKAHSAEPSFAAGWWC